MIKNMLKKCSFYGSCCLFIIIFCVSYGVLEIEQFALGLKDINEHALKTDQLIFDKTAEFIHLANKPNSTELLEKLAALYLNEKSDTDEIKKTETLFLQVLEKEIMNYVNNLPEELKKLLPNWKKNFEKFKDKIVLIKSVYNDFTRDFTPVDKNYHKLGVFNSFYILTALGLKPFSIESWSTGSQGKEFQQDMAKRYAEVINKKYKDDLVFFEIPSKQEKALVCRYPLIPFDFIVKSYEYDSKQIKISDTGKQLIKQDFSEVYKDFIEYAWISDSDVKSADDVALLLGYALRIFDLDIADRSSDKKEKRLYKRSNLLSDQAYAFKSLYIPGNMSIFERTTYIRLYEMLLVYAWVSLVGSKKFLINLGSLVKIYKQYYDKASDFTPFEKVIEERANAKDEDFIKIAQHVLQQAQKNYETMQKIA